jgi:hypothetical protein
LNLLFENHSPPDQVDHALGAVIQGQHPEGVFQLARHLQWEEL